MKREDRQMINMMHASVFALLVKEELAETCNEHLLLSFSKVLSQSTGRS